ncbi:dihydrolipoamide acetyltransferase component of pyruvate dehydrogenase complex [Kitasatospora phosalacinea]|uniref:Dihydrolipoamide acetyltransferase component of pyruvate dehydrogenase complex n=1 Tax=Kitasatospora phosalacinea TaxID=2065 RepID=A0A9W6Q281_9ACTN|nr:dihydrolipoamide acetyltransferase family protein [Kitasatospora phosalacinea]GLW68605.1 dihydrolipoamide acetyltransferase component of pyruvate dehydrogenase complex [Kitasatospora phosalacinea]
MPVVREFTLPDLGEGLTGAEVVRWMVEVGEVIAVDQPVVEVETAKAVVEVPCPYGGVVTARYGEVGQEVPVGAPLVTVAVAPVPGGADEPAVERPLVGYGVAETRRAGRRRVRPAGASAEVPAVPAVPAEVPAAAPGVAPAAAAPGVAPAAAAAPGVVAVISPLVRRIAREHGLDLAAVPGSGPDGLVTRRDVERAIAATSAPEPAVVPRGTGPEDELVPLRGLRRAVAEKLTRSHREIPAATCWVDADATALMALRAESNRAPGPKLSVLALLARICLAGLERFPELNASVEGEAVRRHASVHLGFAAQGPRGLLVPVVRDAGRLGTERLAQEMARLTEGARAGTLAPAELTGGTFTLNNYGVFGVDGSTPILNHPEAAMLGVGRIAPKPWVHEGELAVRQVTQLSFTFDHRVCDGGTAGGFLRFVADCVERPGALVRAL